MKKGYIIFVAKVNENVRNQNSRQEDKSNNGEKDVSRLASGMYIVKVGDRTTKVVKK